VTNNEAGSAKRSWPYLIWLVTKNEGRPEVLVANDGVSALKIFDFSGRIDLLVSDIGLPANIDGLQLANSAWLRRPGLKVLFVTRYLDYSEVGSRLRTGGVEVLIKPFKLDTLARKVQSILAAH